MRLSTFRSLSAGTDPVVHRRFADQGYNNLLLDGSYIRFNNDGAVPEVLIRIPYIDKVMRIQGGDELRFPMSHYYDVKVPLRFQFTSRFSMK